MSLLNWFGVVYREDAFRVDGQWGMMMRLQPPVDTLADCSPAQVINGYGRIVSPESYIWVSGSLPAWISLNWDKPQKIHSVYITFDTDMNNPPMTYPQFPLHPYCATDFTLQGLTEAGEWISLCDITGNYQRCVKIDFPEASLKRVKLNITATGGDQQARVIEIRCY